MSTAPHRQLRRRGALAIVTVVATSLAAALSGPAAAADAGSIVLSGTIDPDYVDAAHPAPQGDAYRLRAVNEDSVLVKEIITDATFSVTLPAGPSYALQAEAIDNDSWYPTWNGGNSLGWSTNDSPVETDALRLTTTTGGIDINLIRTAPVAGTVTAAPIAAARRTDFVVQAWFSSADNLVLLKSVPVTSTPGTDVPYSFAGDTLLPEGSYVFRLAEEGYPNYDDEYHPELPRLAKEAYEQLWLDGLTDIDFTPTKYESTVNRLAGIDRYETAVLTSRSGYRDYDTTMYIASGANWPDALSAGPAASKQNGSLLLTDPDTLSDGIAEEIRSSHPQRIVVVGSALSVSNSVLNSLDALTDAPVVRIAGKDRYETSRKIIDDAFPNADYSTVFLATGTAFPDALSVAPIAGRLGLPVLLVDGARNDLDSATRTAISRLSPDTAELVGGAPSISRGIETALTSSDLVNDVHRVAGTDRHDTSRKINDLYPPATLTDEVYIASATSFADALAAGPAAADRGAPLYLSEPTCLPTATRTAIQHHNLDYVTILGGTPTLAPPLDTLTTC